MGYDRLKEHPVMDMTEFYPHGNTAIVPAFRPPPLDSAGDSPYLRTAVLNTHCDRS